MSDLLEKLIDIKKGTPIVIPRPRDQETLIGLYHSHQHNKNIEIICDPASRIHYDDRSERLIVQPHWQKPRTRYPFEVAEKDTMLVGEEVFRELEKLGIKDYIPFIRIMEQLWELRKTKTRYELSFINFYALISEQDP